LILYYNNKLSKAYKDLISITKLLIFIATSCKRIQKEREKHNKLIVFFATSLILINSITSRFRKENLKSLITNKERQIEVLILINASIQN